MEIIQQIKWNFADFLEEKHKVKDNEISSRLWKKLKEKLCFLENESSQQFLIN